MEIVPRSSWGARSARGFGPAPLPAREVWLHHSVTAAPPSDRVAEVDAMRALERIGQSRFGGGVSYTFAVMPSGRIYEGHGVDRRGAHTKGRNSIARAVVLVGNYDEDEVTVAQVRAVRELLAHGKAEGWWVDDRLAGGHRQAPGAQTACPGRFGMRAVAQVNSSAPIPQPSPAPPTDWFDMATQQDLRDVVRAELAAQRDDIAADVWGRFKVRRADGTLVPILDALSVVYQRTADPAALAAALAKHIPAGSLTTEQIEDAVRNVFADASTPKES